MFDVIDPDVANGERLDRMASAHRRSCDRFGEPIRWGIEGAKVGELLRTCGWTLRQPDTPLAAAERLFDRGGAPFTTPGEPLPFFSFVNAVVGGDSAA